MKQCPTCEQTYNDETLNFCLLDGAPLSGVNSEATVVIPKPAASATVQYAPATSSSHHPGGDAPPLLRGQEGSQKSSGRKALIWAAVIIGMLAASVVVAGVLFVLLGGRSDLFAGNTKVAVNVLPSPKRSATPKTSPSPSPVASPVEEPSAPVKGGTTDEDEHEEDEVTPIAWNTAAVGFKNDVGRKYRFECPANGTASAVWGSDIYTADSSICTAAVHAGVLELEDGGEVTIEFRPGRSIYGSTERHGITSNTFGEYPHSFVVR